MEVAMKFENVVLTLMPYGIEYADVEGDLVEQAVDRIHAQVKASSAPDTWEKEVIGFAQAAEKEGFIVKFDPTTTLMLSFLQTHGLA
jgi:hypothetical protein